MWHEGRETGNQPPAANKGSDTTYTFTCNEDLLAARNSDTHTASSTDTDIDTDDEFVDLILQALETPDITPLNDAYCMHYDDAFRKLPQITLMVQGKEITFLADSGATHSLIRKADLPQCKSSGRLFTLWEQGDSPQKKPFLRLCRLFALLTEIE